VAYFRSQHDNQSWVAALAMLLDACALVRVCADQVSAELTEQAHYTYASARHTAVDVGIFFHRRAPRSRYPLLTERLPPADLEALGAALEAADLRLEAAAGAELAAVRMEYEPSLRQLGVYLLMPLPRWVQDEGVLDDWESTV
jgi:hypothetical protein